MFTIRRKFEINIHELIDFVRLIGRIGLKFNIGDEYIVEGVNGVKERFRRIVVFGTRRQISELLDARDIIVNYCRH